MLFTDMHQVIVSLASNCNQKENLNQARERLGQILSLCRFTKALWTEPYGSEKGKTAADRLYLNQLAYAETALPVAELVAVLKAIERDMGRTEEDRSQGIVRIDLDLLQYDKERFHLRDWNRSYIKALLSL